MSELTMLDKIQLIKDSLPIEDVVSRYTTLKKNGKEKVGLCPLHNEKTPSFSVNEKKGTFFCHGCKKGGSIIDFVMYKENKQTPKEAAIWLNRAFSLNIDFSPPQGAANNILHRTAKAVMEFFVSKLLDPRYKSQAGYLRHRYQFPFSKKSTYIKHQIGYAPRHYSFAADLNKNALKQLGLINKNGQAILRDRVIFPILNRQGSPIAFAGRAISNQKPKYLNTCNSTIYNKSRNLYGMHLYKGSAKIIILEGYLDVIYSAFLHEDNLPLSSCGTSFSFDHAMIVKRLMEKGSKVSIFIDGDAAGRTAALRTIKALTEVDIIPTVIIPPNGMDPADCFKHAEEETGNFKFLKTQGAIQFAVENTGSLDEVTTVFERCRSIFTRMELSRNLQKFMPDYPQSGIYDLLSQKYGQYSIEDAANEMIRMGKA